MTRLNALTAGSRIGSLGRKVRPGDSGGADREALAWSATAALGLEVRGPPGQSWNQHQPLPGRPEGPSPPGPVQAWSALGIRLGVLHKGTLGAGVGSMLIKMGLA